MAAPKRTWICPPRAVDPLRERINGNTMKGRRVRHRRRLYLAKLVNPDDPLQRTFAADCAELAVAIEDLQGRAVAGDGDDVADLLVRMRNELRRAEGKLQFRGSKDEPDDWFEQQRRLAAEGAR